MKKYYIFVVLTLLLLSAKSQIDAGPDTTICIGESVELQGSGPGMYSYTWTSVPNDPTISNPNILTPTVTPSDTTIYTLEARSVSLVNLVQNGDFEDGNTGFTSEYTYSPGYNALQPEGTYAITNDASWNHTGFQGCGDHTSGSGNYMAVNGAQQTNVKVWSTTIFGITPNTEYEFSAWVTSLVASNPAILQFKINDELLGSPFTASGFTCVWIKFFETWDSGNSTTATISIVNQNTAGSGNDFALDDINFNAVSYYYDDCTVNVRDVPTSTFALPAEMCSVDTAIVTYTGSASTSAIYNWEFGSATVISGIGSGPYELIWSTSGLKTISLMVEEGCESESTSHTINIKQSPSSELTADATSIPYGTTTVLHATMDGNPGPLNFEWTPDNMLQDPNITDPETVILQNSTLFTFTVTDGSSLCSSFDTLTIHITGGPLVILSLEALPSTICLGQSSDIEIQIEGGSGNYISTWTSDPPGFNHSGSETVVSVEPTENTTYFVEVTDGFSTLPPQSIEIIVLPLVEITLNPSDTLIEAGETAVYKVDGINNLSFQWQLSTDNGANWNDITDNATYDGATTSTLTVSNATVDMDAYLYRCFLDGECSPLYSDNAMLNVVLAPEVIGGIEDNTVCEQQTVSLVFDINNFIDIDSLHFIATYDDNKLEFIDITNINNEISDLQFTNSNDTIYFDWSSDIGVSINDGSIFSLNFLAIKDGQPEVNFISSSIIRNSYGFYPSLSLTSSIVTINPLPLIPDQVIATPDSLNVLDEVDISLEAFGGSGTEMIWTSDSCGGEYLGNSNPLEVFRPKTTTNYFVKWQNQCGVTECSAVTVKISEDFIFAVPNAFSPNGDGKNDEFGVVANAELDFFEINIFNRWGQLIFSSKNQYDLWDGKINGEDAPVGVYIWKVFYQFRSEGPMSESHKDTGTVTLVK